MYTKLVFLLLIVVGCSKTHVVRDFEEQPLIRDPWEDQPDSREENPALDIIPVDSQSTQEEGEGEEETISIEPSTHTSTETL